MVNEKGDLYLDNAERLALLKRADRLIKQRDDLLALAKDFCRQVEEFAGWDEMDWPAALAALQRYAASFRTIIAKAEGKP